MTHDETDDDVEDLTLIRGSGAPRRSRADHDEVMTTNEEMTMSAIEHTPSQAATMLGDLTPDVLRRIALAHRRARRLLEDARMLVREQVELESLVGGRVVADDDIFYELRQATGLVALESVLGNAATIISAPGGGLWCGGGPRPWPATAWQLDEHENPAADR